MLMILPNAQVVVSLDHAIQGLQLPDHELEQRRLAASVGAHKGHAAVEVDTKVNVAVQHLQRT